VKDVVKKTLAKAFGLDQLSLVELPGIEPDGLPGLLASELVLRYVSFRFGAPWLPAVTLSGLDGVKTAYAGASRRCVAFA
jgi:hypothetical protein